ncbi:TetR/AcrR family transcriptional regulator [Stackebrandtia nassauensis]|uniref:Transcriptional regulator, TetR family n=1 Tax=Stackebrandtia nassauensis (strain DSM 44728 / CIP 108903 / NRRL B-16338 / NBRC 102104 / LLR-40K-21) TaxID=446470 RepID=D3QBZ3_STANL|nr:TetR/AcrR family transcriptional regulator [Stackebrandtia nassauensis]ADD44882.1 transcriptional regulator, TetR family [Stackebrandtia nassauensis DSM 44728]
MTETRDRLLDAATEILFRDGAQALTLAAVADHAGVSKGGLLYHFPSKQALAAGLVHRFVEQFEAALESAGTAPGAATRAYLSATIAPKPSVAGSGGGQATAALFAAALVDPDALEPLRQRYLAWQRRLADDGIDPAVATTVRLAVDGWWLARVAVLAPPQGELHERVYAKLTALIEEG